MTSTPPKLNRDEGRRAHQRIANPESLAHRCQHLCASHRCLRVGRARCYHHRHGGPDLAAEVEGGMALHRHCVSNPLWNLGVSAPGTFPGTVRLIPSSIRYLIGMLRQDHLTEAIRSVLSTASVPNFTLVSLEPQLKEGGLFVRYRYQDLDDDGTAVKTIEEQLRTTLADRGGIPSWANLARSEVWAVKGVPWREVRMFRSRARFLADSNIFRT